MVRPSCKGGNFTLQLTALLACSDDPPFAPFTKASKQNYGDTGTKAVSPYRVLCIGSGCSRLRHYLHFLLSKILPGKDHFCRCLLKYAEAVHSGRGKDHQCQDRILLKPWAFDHWGYPFTIFSWRYLWGIIFNQPG